MGFSSDWRSQLCWTLYVQYDILYDPHNIHKIKDNSSLLAMTVMVHGSLPSPYICACLKVMLEERATGIPHPH